MRTGGTRVGNRCYIQAGTQISPSSRVARRLCCEDPGTCLYREACNRYTELVPMAARPGVESLQLQEVALTIGPARMCETAVTKTRG